MLKLHIKGGEIIEGKVFAIDPITSFIIIHKSSDGSYQMVNPQFISKLEGNLNDTLTPNLPSMGITTLKGIDKRELDSLITAEKNLAALNSKVDNKTQLLFDSFNKIYPCRWDGNIMIILDTFLIEPPYNSVKASPDQKSSTDEAGLKRIEMQLLSERRKLGFE